MLEVLYFMDHVLMLGCSHFQDSIMLVRAHSIDHLTGSIERASVEFQQFWQSDTSRRKRERRMKSAKGCTLTLVWLIFACFGIGQGSAYGQTPAKSEASVGDNGETLKRVETKISELQQAEHERRIADDARLRELEGSIDAVKAEVTSLKANEPTRLRRLVEVLVSLAAIAAFILSGWQYLEQRRRETPRARGRALLRWKRDESSLPRPDFRIELRNETQREVKLAELVFHLQHGSEKHVEVLPGKMHILAPGEAMEMEIPRLSILDVSRVEALSPTKNVWPIEWNVEEVRREAMYRNLETTFLANAEAEQWALNLFQVRDKFYVSRRSNSPDTGRSEFVSEGESESAARSRFEQLCSEVVKYQRGATVEKKDIYTVTDARSDFEKYWA